METLRRTLPRRAEALAALFRETATRWVGDRCYRLGASLAYYAIFSLFPLLLLLVTVVGYLLGDSASARLRLLDSLGGATGSPAVRSLLDDTLASMQAHRAARGIGMVVGLVTLLFGASGVFSELDTSLNAIWRVSERSADTLWKSVLEFLRGKALAFGLVIASGVLFLASLATDTALNTFANAASGRFPIPFAWGGVELLASIVFLTVSLAAMYRTLPHTRVAWRDVLGGALLAAALLTALKWLLAYYLAHLGSYAAYGVVGGVLALLLLIYCASLVIFFGAEFTRVYAERRGSLAAARGAS
jgi:membrane protein